VGIANDYPTNRNFAVIEMVFVNYPVARVRGIGTPRKKLLAIHSCDGDHGGVLALVTKLREKIKPLEIKNAPQNWRDRYDKSYLHSRLGYKAPNQFE
jgi:hypothetical protein